jgi:ribose 5-phosphate isomerase A
MSYENEKKNVGAKAAELIRSGMIVGLGSGTTATCFLLSLAKRVHEEKLSIKTIPTSQETASRARDLKVPLLPIDQVYEVDITVDGADEIDDQKNMIKGKGGALVREKILASMSKEMVVIIDESKLVSQLGRGPLPVEIIPFGHQGTLHKLEKLGYKGKWRKKDDGSLFITDNHNYILDLSLPKGSDDPEREHELISEVIGVVDTGFFFNLAGRVIIGFRDGQVVIR